MRRGGLARPSGWRLSQIEIRRCQGGPPTPHRCNGACHPTEPRAKVHPDEHRAIPSSSGGQLIKSQQPSGRPSYEFKAWQGRKDSNPRPSVLETDALTRLSYAPIGRSQILPSQYDPGVIDSGFRTSGAKRAEQEATKGGFGAKRAQWLLTICPS